jgi:hypothetical protein
MQATSTALEAFVKRARAALAALAGGIAGPPEYDDKEYCHA